MNDQEKSALRSYLLGLGVIVPSREKPEIPSVGDVFWDKTENTAKVYSGSEFVKLNGFTKNKVKFLWEVFNIKGVSDETKV